MKIQIICLFPEMFREIVSTSMLRKAQDISAVEFSIINLRDYGIGKRKTLDDTPYGGGDGMVLKPEPVFEAIEFAKANDPLATVILPTPRGKLYKQSDAKALAKSGNGLIIFCPRYEGYDERITTLVDKQYCVGNYVLTGGEIPAMIIFDSVVRLLPGVLGGEHSVDFESFQSDDVSIEHPQYTRPAEYRGLKVPEVLLNGNHQQISKFRQ
ncbi:MAG TPA: tRNA (guanosine(37)-N1)-methyltransferase TrmD [Candidatus Saccharimonadales bacterium]|nr:tRNA (guanosine(37)-N1)-methyltransferase TrmD [Candidatus Saccharimonadales bacterium]